MPNIASPPSRNKLTVVTALVSLCAIAFILVIVTVGIYGMNGTMDLMHKVIAGVGM